MTLKIQFSIILLLQAVIFCQKYCSKCGQILGENKFHQFDGISKRRWQSPKPGNPNYQQSYQDFHSLVGYADIKYTDLTRQEADVCILAIHRTSSKLKYFFDNAEQSENCRRFDGNWQKTGVGLRVEASDGAKLDLGMIDFFWNVQSLKERPGDYRNGQKGAIVEMFGWQFKEVEQECDLIGRAGYLGVKISPVNEHIMSDEPERDALNPWYYVYQPISYRFNSRGGTLEELSRMIRTCRSHGVRVYVDIVLNHFTSSMEAASGKKSSAPPDRQSPFFTYRRSETQVNPNTNEPFTFEYPGAAIGPEDFHCERALDKWDDLNILNTGWLAGLADLNTTRANVRERQAAYLVELLSLGVSGFRIDAGKHMSPDDLATIMRLVRAKLGGGRLPDDFVVWLEVLTGEQAYVLWDGPSWYGARFTQLLLDALDNATSDLDKVKIFDSGYPTRPWENTAVASTRVVIQNDDHDSQSPDFCREFGDRGCVLVKGCAREQHRYYEQRLFEDPYEVRDRDHDWPIRILLSSFYHTYGALGVPDGLSDCNLSKLNRDQCKESVPYFKASESGKCAYEGPSYTRVHRDIAIINSMRNWMHLNEINGEYIGLPNCY